MRLVALVLSLTSLTASAADPPKTRVAMLAIRVEQGVSQGAANLLGDVIAADATRSPKHQLITATDVNASLSAERQRQLLGCSDEQASACLAEIGAALGAEYLLDVGVGAVGNLRILSLRLIDAREGRAVRRESESVPSEAELVASCHRLTAKLFDLPLEPSKKGRVVPGLLVLGGAGLLAAGGVGFGIAAQSDVRAYAASPFNEALAASAQTKAGVADGLYAGAIVAAAVSAFLIITGTAGSADGAGGGT